MSGEKQRTDKHGYGKVSRGFKRVPGKDYAVPDQAPVPTARQPFLERIQQMFADKPHQSLESMAGKPWEDTEIFGAPMARYFLALGKIQESELPKEQKKDFGEIVYLAIAYQIATQSQGIGARYLCDLTAARMAEKGGLKGITKLVENKFREYEREMKYKR